MHQQLMQETFEPNDLQVLRPLKTLSLKVYKPKSQSTSQVPKDPRPAGPYPDIRAAAQVCNLGLQHFEKGLGHGRLNGLLIQASLSLLWGVVFVVSVQRPVQFVKNLESILLPKT